MSIPDLKDLEGLAVERRRHDVLTGATGTTSRLVPGMREERYRKWSLDSLSLSIFQRDGVRRRNELTVEPAVLTRAGHSIDFCEWPVIPGIEARSGVNEGSAREALEAGGAQLDTAILMHLASEHQTECERRCEQKRGERFPHWC